jgi:hypothetical protein
MIPAHPSLTIHPARKEGLACSKHHQGELDVLTPGQGLMERNPNQTLPEPMNPYAISSCTSLMLTSVFQPSFLAKNEPRKTALNVVRSSSPEPLERYQRFMEKSALPSQPRQVVLETIPRRDAAQRLSLAFCLLAQPSRASPVGSLSEATYAPTKPLVIPASPEELPA